MSKTILLVDDDPMIVDVLRYQLEKEGYQVILAYDGQQALEKAREVKPDLILLDVMMPQKDGWEVCQEIRRTNSVPILMITARGEEMDRVLGLELGADDYIVKPFSFRELLARIRAIFRRVTLYKWYLQSCGRRIFVLRPRGSTGVHKSQILYPTSACGLSTWKPSWSIWSTMLSNIRPKEAKSVSRLMLPKVNFAFKFPIQGSEFRPKKFHASLTVSIKLINPAVVGKRNRAGEAEPDSGYIW